MNLLIQENYVSLILFTKEIALQKNRSLKYVGLLVDLFIQENKICVIDGRSNDQISIYADNKRSLDLLDQIYGWWSNSEYDELLERIYFHSKDAELFRSRDYVQAPTITNISNVGQESSEIVETRNRERTKMLRMVNLVNSRFYGLNFDPVDRDTWTSQNVVVAWLMSEHKLSKNESKAIDLVTRPDQARNKK